MKFRKIRFRNTPISKILIDNAFHNNSYENAIFGNLTTDISDHLAQFWITLTFATIILTQNFKDFSHENFKNDLRQVDWTDTLNLELSNVSHSFEKFFNKIHHTLDKLAPYK